MNRLAIFTALLMTLAACAKTVPEQTRNTSESVHPPAASAPSTVQVNASPSTEPPKSAAPDQTTAAAEVSGAVSKPLAETEIKKLYRMNPKTYDIVPIDPAGNKKVVLLTFDDGPKEKEMIDSIIDTLDKHKAKAIFFVNGYRVKKNPDLLKLIHNRGQIIGNHAWDHDDLKKMSSEKVDQQLDDVQSIVRELTGETPVFFRPPFGSGSDYVREKAKKEHLLYMTWSNGSKDWEMTVKKNNPDEVVQNVLDQLHFGSNILMHELPWTVKALDTLLTKLEEKGYGFVDPRSIEGVTP
ncbi:polysaccharide deacetylase family protein [Paenibacillus hamazuiensis]|uniref:polysaccharide deacetylase family protein n=1 Tax=Paenibacillus hamazuiensis TaxID=2936508 RepID=UPI00200F42C6|nr:polysaccharide deacetylase family protein [Paenibacillus hamazuiensis]